MPLFVNTFSDSTSKHHVTHMVISKRKIESAFSSKVVDFGSNKRMDLIHESNFLQAAIIEMNESDTFIPHLHPTRPVQYDQCRTQEIWFVTSGSVLMTLYDEDATRIEEVLLEAGDFAITLRGGHNYKAVFPNTSIIEIKSGPYDKDRDKIRF